MYLWQSLVLLTACFDTGGCSIPDMLAPGATFDCMIGPFPAESDQHTNTASAIASFENQVVNASNDANYIGVEEDDTNDELPVVIVIEGPVESINININYHLWY